MSRVLFAWELGGGYGHADRMAEVARRLAAMGHAIAVVSQSLPLMRRVFADITTEFDEAPLAPAGAEQRFADSYADVLLRCGFDDPAALGARLDAWGRLLDRRAPDLVITDFAPTAMLAARLAGVPVAALENGYSLPPPGDPLPFTRAWQTADPARLRSLDEAALATIDACMAARNRPGLGRLAGLFDVAAQFLCTVPELDHYQDRGEAAYFGPIFAPGKGEAPDWPDRSGPRVFAYVDAGNPATAHLLEALEQTGWPTVMHRRGGGADGGGGGSVRIHAEPLRFDLVLAQCDLVVTQGLATVSGALLAGRPVVQAPAHLEQMMILHRVVHQGLGVGLLRGADLHAAKAALDMVWPDGGFADRATAFARRYHGLSSDLAADAIAAECAELL